MRIIAESRPVVAMPFVHLGYVAASYIRPSGGLALTGTILAVAGISMAFRLGGGKRLRTHILRRKSRAGAIGLALLLVGIACVAVAWMAGERYYPHGESATSVQMQMILQEIDWRANSTPDGKEPGRGTLVGYLPAEAGVYDLVSILQGPTSQSRSRDGWKNPMKLRVVVTDGQKPDYILMSAGEDRTWYTEDDRTSERHAEAWRKQWRELGVAAAEAAAARDKQRGGQPK